MVGVKVMGWAWSIGALYPRSSSEVFLDVLCIFFCPRVVLFIGPTKINKIPIRPILK